MKYNLRMTEELEKRPLEDGEMELQMFQVVPGTGRFLLCEQNLGSLLLSIMGIPRQRNANPKGQVPGVMDIHGILGYHRDMT